MREKVRALIERHCVTLATESEAVNNCLKRLDDPSQVASAVIAEGVELAHKIKGSSGSIGFPEISTAAAMLEHYLQSLADKGGIVSQARHDELFAHYHHLARLVKSVHPEASTLYDAQFPGTAERG